MKSIYSTYIILLISIFGYSQNERVENLENQKRKVELKIQDLTDSLKLIELKIAKIESEKFLNKIQDSSFSITVRNGAKLRKDFNVFGDIIKRFDDDKEVTVIGYEKGWFHVCYNSICGFINEVWVNKDQKTYKFIRSIETQNKLTEQINRNSFNSEKTKSTESNSNTYKPAKKRFRNSRIYYRGPRGGCYYINSNGNKSYVDRSLCN